MSFPAENGHAVILFDGVCNLCNAAVQFVIAHDPGGIYHFAALQSPAGVELAAAYGLDALPLDSVILIEGGRAYTGSEAALRIVGRLATGWRWLGMLRVLPRPLRDGAYRFVARHRYRWFGRRQACMLPTEEVRGRFL